jgi:hypothetical protein
MTRFVEMKDYRKDTITKDYVLEVSNYLNVDNIFSIVKENHYDLYLLRVYTTKDNYTYTYITEKEREDVFNEIRGGDGR